MSSSISEVFEAVKEYQAAHYECRAKGIGINAAGRRLRDAELALRALEIPDLPHDGTVGLVVGRKLTAAEAREIGERWRRQFDEGQGRMIVLPEPGRRRPLLRRLWERLTP